MIPAAERIKATMLADASRCAEAVALKRNSRAAIDRSVTGMVEINRRRDHVDDDAGDLLLHRHDAPAGVPEGSPVMFGRHHPKKARAADS